MKQKVKELALQAGGSHYPEVGGELLQKFADLMLAEVINAISTSDVRQVVYTNYDQDRAESIKAIHINTIKDLFKE